MDRAYLTYRVGNEHNPGDPFGRAELTIAVDGVVRLEHVTRERRRSFSGRVEPTALERLWSALAVSGFPVVPEQGLVGGATLRELAVGLGDARRTALIEWYTAATIAGYRDVFAILDTVIRQVGSGCIDGPPVAGSMLVTDVTSG